LQPGLAALLAHDPIGAPGRQRIVKPFVGRAHRLLAGISKAHIVKISEIAQAVIRQRGLDPGVAAITQHVSKSAAVLKKKERMCAQRAIHRVPVDGVVTVDIKIGDDGDSIFRHVGRRCEVGLLDVLQFIDQGLLRGASAAGVFGNRSLIHSDREGKSRMALSGRHHQLRRLIFRVVRSVPIDDHAINAAADHVIDLAVNLVWIGRTVAHVHMVRLSEPYHQMGVDLGVVSRVKQSVNVNFADISGAQVPIRLGCKTVSRARVVCSLSG